MTGAGDMSSFIRRPQRGGRESPIPRSPIGSPVPGVRRPLVDFRNASMPDSMHKPRIPVNPPMKKFFENFTTAPNDGDMSGRNSRTVQGVEEKIRRTQFSGTPRDAIFASKSSCNSRILICFLNSIYYFEIHSKSKISLHSKFHFVPGRKSVANFTR